MFAASDAVCQAGACTTRLAPRVMVSHLFHRLISPGIWLLHGMAAA
jgi:hypothetical protein